MKVQTDYEIRTNMGPDGCGECDCTLKGQFCSIVMAYDHKDGVGSGWYNTGIVEWAKTPDEAFKNAFERFKRRQAESLSNKGVKND